MNHTMQTAIRYHDISCGHRVVGHEGKCRYLHGHNYRIHFTCEAAALDSVGRVIDFGAMKEKLCGFLESRWDHKFLVWDDDPVLARLDAHKILTDGAFSLFVSSFVFVPFNPTAENIAKYLLEVVGPKELNGTHVRLVRVQVDETRKCGASAENWLLPVSTFEEELEEEQHG